VITYSILSRIAGTTLLILLLTVSAFAQSASNQPGIQIYKSDDTIRVESDGELLTEYHYKDVPRPYFYPVIGPTGIAVNRHWPMKDGEHEEPDHPHHRSLWMTHGDVNGHDFWSESDQAGKIVHDKFLSIDSQAGVIISTNNWIALGGKTICTDTRTHRFQSLKDAQLVDFEVTIHASHGKLVLGDTKEGSMAMRLAPTMRLKGEVGQGNIVNSAGDRDNETWGKRAAWCDYYGPLDGKTVGVAIFDHPSNPRHPTWWHVRDYGLFAANPFGLHYFENKPEGAGDMTIPAGESRTFRYRLYLHKGNEQQAKVAEFYEQYAKEVNTTP
jgi:hypothetical protein